MGVGTLLRRRLLTHPVALVAVATSVLMSMVVVATLQLLSSAIADASVRTTLDVPGEQRSVALTAGVRPGELADVAQDVPVAGGTVGEVLLAWDHVGTEPRDGGVRVPASSVAVLRVG